MTTKQEWEHIAVYNSARADAANEVLQYFEAELPEHIARWFRIEKEYRQEAKDEAEKELAL